MITKILIVITVIHLNCFAYGGTDTTSFIHYGLSVGKLVQYPNGTYDVPNTAEYPFMASLEVNGIHECGAVIIKSNAVLTAAHCTKDHESNALGVRAGTYIKQAKEFPGSSIQVRNVQKYITHGSFNNTGLKEFDICFIWLETPFELTTYVNIVERANFMDYKKFMGEKVEIIGWGRMQTGVRPKNLLRATVVVSPINLCRAVRKVKKNISNSMICVQPSEYGEGPCNGDSGGPLIVQQHKNGIKKPLLIGVASSNLVLEQNNFCLTVLGSIYTDVAYFEEWINSWLQ